MPPAAAMGRRAGARAGPGLLGHAVGDGGSDWLQRMYGNQPDRWRDDLAGDDRWRIVANAMTRLRFCSADGQMEFATRTRLERRPRPPALVRACRSDAARTSRSPSATGRRLTVAARNPLALDTGCLWGGCPERSQAGALGRGSARVAEIVQVKVLADTPTRRLNARRAIRPGEPGLQAAGSAPDSAGAGAGARNSAATFLRLWM